MFNSKNKITLSYLFFFQFAYNRRGDVFKLCRSLMSLPFLPANHIEAAIHHLTQQTKDATLLKLILYFKKTWITGFYEIASWCVFKQSTRTNNDVEGWHRRLNKKTDDEKSPFYLLVIRLYEEAQLLPIQRKLVSEGKLSRYQRKQVRSNQAIMFNLWDEYTAGSISASRLLNQCGRVHGPVVEA
jgi:hypothetical protein